MELVLSFLSLQRRDWQQWDFDKKVISKFHNLIDQCDQKDLEATIRKKLASFHCLGCLLELMLQQ